MAASFSSCVPQTQLSAFAVALRLTVLLFATLVVHATATANNYEFDAKDIDVSKRNARTEFEFVPLAPQEVNGVEIGGRQRRQTSGSNTLNTGKSRSGSVPPTTKGTQKLDKNSASNPTDDGGSSGQIKNLSSSPENDDDSLSAAAIGDEKEDYDEQIIADMYNASDQATVEKPRIHHDHHLYYNSTIVMEPQRISEFWVDMEKMNKVKVVVHEMLSKSYRRAATVSLSFDFPFYGHILRNATIATGGFLYLGDYMHSWLASTQYIAPLMANFDTRINADSVIKYADNGTDFVVQWEETSLQDFANAGTFTFQARLRNTGDIVFAYSKIPVGVSSIPDSEHPVRIGVSDAYIIDRAMLFHTRKIIYEYHRVEIKKDNIANLTAVYLTALPSCITMKDCESCINTDIQFDCSWCVQAKRCSDGMDRYRHEWLYKGCDAASQQLHEPGCPVPGPGSNWASGGGTSMANISKVLAPNETDSILSTPSEPIVLPTPPPQSTEESENNTDTISPTVSNLDFDTNARDHDDGVVPQSSLPTSPPSPHAISDTASSIDMNSKENVAQMDRQYGPVVQGQRRHQDDTSLGTVGVIAIIFSLSLIAGLVIWVTYAYKYPHSSSGQIIIRYRPSRWHWLKGEDDYTPASVHI